MKRLVPALALVAIIAVALVITSRGEERESALPQLSAQRLDGEGEYQLSALADKDEPTLLWFWAPWCTVCNAEAGKIEQLAADLDVVAIGGRDEVANAPAFVARHGLTTPTLLFDEPMAIWEHYRIPAQPGAVLLDRDGREQRRWNGAFDTAEALEAARAL